MKAVSMGHRGSTGSRLTDLPFVCTLEELHSVLSTLSVCVHRAVHRTEWTRKGLQSLYP